MKAKLIWNEVSMKDRKKRFEKAQDYVDDQCLKLMSIYVPVGLRRFRNSGKLRDSAKIIEPGKIAYTSKFAKSDYYAVKRHTPPYGGNPKGRRLWFEFTKKQYGGAILRGAARLAGGKPK